MSIWASFSNFETENISFVIKFYYMSYTLAASNKTWRNIIILYSGTATRAWSTIYSQSNVFLQQNTKLLVVFIFTFPVGKTGLEENTNPDNNTLLIRHREQSTTRAALNRDLSAHHNLRTFSDCMKAVRHVHFRPRTAHNLTI